VPTPDVPTAIWSELKAHVLKRILKRAVVHERYEQAARLKDELGALNSLLMQALEGSLRDRVSQMRKQVRASAELQLQIDLSIALAEEDYSKAAATRAHMDAVQRASPPFAGIRNLLHLALLESDLDTRIALGTLHRNWVLADVEARVRRQRGREAERLRQDAAFRLQHQLHHAVVLEEYDRAAKIRDALDAENRRREIEQMWSQLQRQVLSVERELLWLQRRPRQLLTYQLEEAVAQEDYEQAEEIRQQLAHVTSEAVLSRLEEQLATAVGQGGARKGESEKLEEELARAVAAEDFQQASSLHRRLLALERSRMMSTLEQKLVEYGANVCLSPDPASEHVTASNQFYYLGNLQNHL